MDADSVDIGSRPDRAGSATTMEGTTNEQDATHRISDEGDAASS